MAKFNLALTKADALEAAKLCRVKAEIAQTNADALRTELRHGRALAP